MRPSSELHNQIKNWISHSNGWFSYWKIDTALSIEGSTAKTLRRVIIKRMVDRGELLKAPDVDGVYKRFTPARRIDWQQKRYKGL